ncbi:hypothetical protein E3E26_08460 [Thermococcus sp. LS1]|nr:hypothetical protein [Thermococcus sp. LS1]
MMRRAVLALVIALMVFVSGCITVVQQTETSPSSTYSPTTSTWSTPAPTTTTATTTPATWTNPEVQWGNLTVLLPSQDAQLNCSGILWRYILKDALPCMLSRPELEVISPLAEKLEGENLVQSAWNVLDWEDQWIIYDREKAKEPFAKVIIYPDGRQEVVEGRNNTIQTPYETIMRGKGICTDYTVLTDALLLAMNYSPVYTMAINLTDLGHAAALVRIEGWFFVIDQHLPPMDLGSYYRYWKRQGSIIINATLYEIMPGENLAEVKTLGILSGKDFLMQDYTMTENDAKALAYGMLNLLAQDFGIGADDSLSLISEGKLPEGYKAGWMWSATFYNLADYYHPIFYEQYVKWLLERMTSDSELVEYFEKSDSAWIEVGIEGNDLVVTLYLGQRQ